MPAPTLTTMAGTPLRSVQERTPVMHSQTSARDLAHPIRRARAQRGASFVELMLAVLVISTTVVASTASMHSSTEVYHYFADGQHEALMLAQEIHEAALLLPWSASPGAPAQFGSDVAKLDDLDNKTYSPPRSAEYEVIVSNIGWSQVVEVNRVDMADPSVEIDPATFTGAYLTELKVTVKEGEQVMGVHNWWLTEPTHD